jgi:signal transduction histidine kinase
LSLFLRLALLLAAVVAVTLAASGLVVTRGVVEPFSEEVFEAFLDEAVYAADQVVAGADPEELGQELGVELRWHERRGGRAAHRWRMEMERRLESEGWRRTTHRGREIAVKRKRQHAAAIVETDEGWMSVRRELDLNAPGQRVRRALLLVGLAALAATLWLAHSATRPLRQARQAIERVAAGDLEGRLPEKGPRELAALARSYNAMVRQVAEMLAAEKSLMAGVSHELRTPITRLRLEVELLRDLGGAALTERRLAAMEGDLAELEGLIAELLESSRLELGQQKLELEALTLREVADEAARRASPGTHPVSVSGEGAPLQGDRERLVRVVSNLLQNAGKYAPEGSPIEVTITGRALEVADRGPGVPEEALERIFTPFYRLEGSRSRETGGVGLGLMIARQVVELHGGIIAARNREGGGLAVRLELPGQLNL